MPDHAATLEELEEAVFSLSADDVRMRLKRLDTQLEFWEKVLDILEPPAPKKPKLKSGESSEDSAQKSVIDGKATNQQAEPEIGEFDDRGKYLPIPQRILMALQRATDHILSVYDLRNQLLLSTQQLQGPLNKLKHEKKIHRNHLLHVCLGQDPQDKEPTQEAPIEIPVQDSRLPEDQPIENFFNSLAGSLRKIVKASGIETPRQLSCLGRRELESRTICGKQSCEQLNDWLMTHFALELLG